MVEMAGDITVLVSAPRTRMCSSSTLDSDFHPVRGFCFHPHRVTIFHTAKVLHWVASWGRNPCRFWCPLDSVRVFYRKDKDG